MQSYFVVGENENAMLPNPAEIFDWVNVVPVLSQEGPCYFSDRRLRSHWLNENIQIIVYGDKDFIAYPTYQTNGEEFAYLKDDLKKRFNTISRQCVVVLVPVDKEWWDKVLVNASPRFGILDRNFLLPDTLDDCFELDPDNAMRIALVDKPDDIIQVIETNYMAIEGVFSSGAVNSDDSSDEDEEDMETNNPDPSSENAEDEKPKVKVEEMRIGDVESTFALDTTTAVIFVAPGMIGPKCYASMQADSRIILEDCRMEPIDDLKYLHELIHYSTAKARVTAARTGYAKAVVLIPLVQSALASMKLLHCDDVTIWLPLPDRRFIGDYYRDIEYKEYDRWADFRCPKKLRKPQYGCSNDYDAFWVTVDSFCDNPEAAHQQYSDTPTDFICQHHAAIEDFIMTHDLDVNVVYLSSQRLIGDMIMDALYRDTTAGRPLDHIAANAYAKYVKGLQTMVQDTISIGEELIGADKKDSRNPALWIDSDRHIVYRSTKEMRFPWLMEYFGKLHLNNTQLQHLGNLSNYILLTRDDAELIAKVLDDPEIFVRIYASHPDITEMQERLQLKLQGHITDK